VPPDTVVLRIPINRYHLAEEGRRRDGGDKTANPLRLAVMEGSAYVLQSCSDVHLVAVHCATCRRYAGPVPQAFAAYLARFRAREWVTDTHTFELVLVAVDD
jgi:hypothetical protein